MACWVVRCNLADPDATRTSARARYAAALEMARYADEHGVDTLQTEEHHGVASGWLPLPFAFAGAAPGATRRLTVMISAVIRPLYGPLRLAEDIAVLDLVSGGTRVCVCSRTGCCPGSRSGPGQRVERGSGWNG
ncbi:alkanesulfonate monooxygenase SsuD/methylene tetrahydromethanopterin reductase-like flavin-dependent oxidoreductase (luciferase family) [Streptomyces candidus]|uniref:Alkanesulfonate monooxygenase SsuD/methylene tetrahydromethanopterin reductase-like flavin-dependent oxidoreductase (Luciferase family) n=1 Tax=Streptomyces candidus TaxID=67283 RepID=A0A7X0HIK2_9ACTN|nr:alkanesulfonate monooxygenase SsuD/methylene tetrahydromethanopterin reductase-like flavin-dependent oxidoreductase (luciferase family) [Streptomyces candidus]GHH52071.1 hypothetical protein GCM10018773_51450 [Streptomyces candidus]